MQESCRHAQLGQIGCPTCLFRDRLAVWAQLRLTAERGSDSDGAVTFRAGRARGARSKGAPRDVSRRRSLTRGAAAAESGPDAARRDRPTGDRPHHGQPAAWASLPNSARRTDSDAAQDTTADGADMEQENQRTAVRPQKIATQGCSPAQGFAPKERSRRRGCGIHCQTLCGGAWDWPERRAAALGP